MSTLLCLLMVAAAPADASAAVDGFEEVEEEVDFEEEEVSFADEEPVVRISLPEVEYRLWLLALPLALIALLAWNVTWRRAAKTHPPRSGSPD